jgi:DNA-binding HxlR family transcriptional regulator
MARVSKRTYEQFCGLAQALDLVGERWTLLVVRDLSLGPQRFGDLLAGLPGIGSGLLTERLRHLEGMDVVQRAQLPPPANVGVYELTPAGHELARAMGPLAAWGARRLPAGRDDRLFRPEWLLLSLRQRFDPRAAEGVHDVYEFRVDGHPVHMRVDDGDLETNRGAAPVRPDLVFSTDPATFIAIGLGEVTVTEAISADRVRIEGPPEVLERCVSVFRLRLRSRQSA